MNKLVLSLVNNPKYCKCLKKRQDNLLDTSLIKKYVDVLQKLDSKYFPKIYKATIEEDSCLIFEEFIGYPTLEVTKEKYYNNEKECLELLKELINALKMIWKENLYHPNLVLKNIIIDERTNKPVIVNLITSKNNSSKKSNIKSLGFIIYQLYLGTCCKEDVKLSKSFKSIVSKLLNGQLPTNFP